MRDYYAQAVPEPCTILGVALGPLRVGHLLLLHRIESVFVTGAATDSPFNELALAVSICAQSFPDGLRTITETEDTQKSMDLWAKKLTRTTPADKRAKRKPVALDIKAEWQAFVDWFARNTKVPLYSYDAEKTTAVDCPEAQIVRAYVQRAFHLSDSEILERSWSQCLWDHVTLKALDGHVRMMDRDSVDEAQAFGKMLAEKLAKGEIRRKGATNGAA